MKKILMVAISLLLTPAAFAIDEAKVQSAADALVTLLAPRMDVLDRDLLLFHYEASNSGSPMTTQEQVYNRLVGAGERFYNPRVYNSDMAGVGLYFAIDPNSSRGFGGTDPHLYVVPIKKGARIINLVADKKGDELDRAKAIYRQLDCDSKAANGSQMLTKLDNMDAIPGAFRNTMVMECRHAIIRAFEKLHVQAIMYGYSASNLQFGCRNRNEAINLIDSSAMRKEMVALYTDSAKVEGPKMARYISALYEMPGTDFMSQLFSPETTKQDLPKSITNVKTVTQAIRSWTKRNIYKCGPNWSPERSGENLLSDFSARLRAAYSDPEIQKSEINWVKAYRKRFGGEGLGISIFARINEIETAMFQASGLKDFDKFKKAADVLEDYQTEYDLRISRASDLLEESPMISIEDTAKIAEMVKTVPASSGSNPGLYPLIMRMAKAGPRMIRLQFNSFSPLFGGSVLLTKEIPYGNSPADRALYETNKTRYLSILRKCAAVYEDSTQPLEVVRSGPCGVRLAGK